VLDLYAADGTCWTAGSLPFSGTRNLAEIALLMEGILSAFPEGLGFTVKAMTAEGDRVAIEAESFGRHVSGRTYNNQYHFLMVIRDGKVREFKEYFDTMHANEVLVWGAEPTQS
jgi:ketosteroid isomerase-like protein